MNQLIERYCRNVILAMLVGFMLVGLIEHDIKLRAMAEPGYYKGVVVEKSPPCFEMFCDHYLTVDWSFGQIQKVWVEKETWEVLNEGSLYATQMKYGYLIGKKLGQGDMIPDDPRLDGWFHFFSYLRFITGIGVICFLMFKLLIYAGFIKVTKITITRRTM